MFKKMDNPWLVRVLMTLLPVFGMVVGTALGPLLAETVRGTTTVSNGDPSYDVYAQFHPEFYKTGALVGFCIGLVLAAGTLIQLARQAAAAEKEPVEAHAH